jgi:hypothetical protein
MKFSGRELLQRNQNIPFSKIYPFVIRGIVRDRIGWQGGLGKPAGPASCLAFESNYT